MHLITLEYKAEKFKCQTTKKKDKTINKNAFDVPKRYQSHDVSFR